MHPFLSRPVKLHWAGWTTDTFELQRAGWRLSAEQNVYEARMGLALSHPGIQMQGVTETLGWDFPAVSMNMGHLQPLRVKLFGRDVHVHLDESIHYAAIDATPQIRPNRAPVSLSEFAHFATPAQQKLIIPEHSVGELMQQILEKQSGARLLRIEDEVRWDIAQKPRFHAQIISLAA